MSGTSSKKKTLDGAMIDKYYKLREKRLKAEKKIKEMKAQETALSQELLEICNKSKLLGGKGKIASISLNTTTVAHVQDWDKVQEFIIENNAFHLLSRRVSDPAFREYLDQGGVPGIEPVVLTKLSLSRNAK